MPPAGESLGHGDQSDQHIGSVRSHGHLIVLYIQCCKYL